MVKFDTNDLRNVFWIAGGSGAGKTTIARRLASKHGLQLYSTDESMSAHAKRSTAGNCPLLHQFMEMSMDDRWLTRSASEMFETFHWFRGEGFEMIVEDILSLPRSPALIVEGFRLLPALVEPLLVERHKAIWLLPSPGFRRAVFESRGGSGWSFLSKTSEPDRALRNLYERDALFTEFLRSETGRLGLQSTDVDEGVSEDALFARVAALLHL